MAGSNRDDFPAAVRNALAHRASHQCSFTGCGLSTSGPSEASLDAAIKFGVAAHVCAAAPGGPRYLASMTPNERSSISNAIWLCPTHAALIDRDSVTYTPQRLRDMKSAHEARMTAEQSGVRSAGIGADFVALGSDIIFSGELVAVEDSTWHVRIEHFLRGELGTLIKFSESFNRINPDERYLLVNALGDGRQLAAPPAWRKTDSGYIVACKVVDSFPRQRAQELPMDMALNDEHDIFAKEGDIATVSGLEALPQKIKLCLSTLRGEMPLQPTFGTRIAEYCDLFRGSAFLPRLIKLEVIRQACVPISDSILRRQYTPFQSVLCVREVTLLPGSPRKDWLPFRFNLDVEGVGPWACDVSIFIPQSDSTRDPIEEGNQ
jgi:hypothetical protein